MRLGARLSVLVALLLFTDLGAAWAQEDAAKVRDLQLAPVAFRPANNGTDFVVEAGGLGRLCGTKGAGYFMAPLQLADGVTIEGVTVFIEDTNRDGLGMMALVRTRPDPPDGKSFEVLALTPVSVGTKDIETLSTTAISAPVIDNKLGAYLLQVVLTTPGVCLHGARVTYRVP